ncbi:polysaccharide deacetylase family protein [Kibdelosporangium persicum]|uniref:Peptidoglycan-N-acetylmuramic acid deacetylase PdaA n=1 Tax=Kibdelosporangium persicum TaxID=2698649 RepID=A0ABX2F3N5_9PSEU|nr:polysaccharide deacetylase family protein [Kibdelosporangium persicum]NRN65951.1 Peptidoglycan-N-acetylmuramic acid deacetylase PdaA [Kibdelosporangium persicum]
MLERLKPFRYVALAAVALLVAAIILVVEEREQPPSRPTGEQTAATSDVVHGADHQSRPAPRIGPAQLVYKVETTDPVVFLTIDDGAHRDPAMAGILRRDGVKATFFLTNRYVRRDPDFFRKLRDDTGSVIQNHSESHENLAGRPLGQQEAEIVPVSDTYARQFGQRPTLFRAPYGNSDDVTLQAAGEAGAKYVVHWGSEIKGGQIRFSGPREFRPGSIVLMHFTENFEADVTAFVTQARANGLRPALLTDYLR